MSHVGVYFEYIMSTLEYGCSVHFRDVMVHMGGHYEYIRGCSVP